MTPTTQSPTPAASSNEANKANKDILVSRVEAYTREEPAKALSAAMGVGILAALFPLGSLVSGLARVLFLVARPLLMILGVVKLADELEARRARSRDSREGDDASSRGGGESAR
jgi:hypothetical protein